MPRYGLKLGIGEEALGTEAARIWTRGGGFDFLELYVPLSTDCGVVRLWDWYDGPLVLHAPHSVGGFNFADPKLRDSNRSMLHRLADMTSAMQPRWVVFHPGYNGDEAELFLQAEWLRTNLPDLHAVALLENKPLVALDGLRCLGASPGDMRRLLGETGCGFCLDVRHATAFAASAGRNWLEVVAEFGELSPSLWHAADGRTGDLVDSHDHFGAGNIDWRRLAPLLNADSMVTIECSKESEAELRDFLEDARYLRMAFESA